MLAFLHLDCGKGKLSIKGWELLALQQGANSTHSEEFAPGKMTLLNAPEIIRH